MVLTCRCLTGSCSLVSLSTLAAAVSDMLGQGAWDRLLADEGMPEELVDPLDALLMTPEEIERLRLEIEEGTCDGRS